MPAGGEPYGDVRHGPLELGEYVAPQVDIAGIFGSQVDRDGQRLAQIGERSLIGDGKGVVAILGEVERYSRLGGDADDGSSDRHAG